MAILNNSNAISSGGYDINNSLRFRSSASAYLNRTLSTPTNNKIWTWSGWVKLGKLSTFSGLFGALNGTDRMYIAYGSSAKWQIYGTNAGTDYVEAFSTGLYRDPSAWYHLVIAVDTTQATASNRLKMYVNGTQETISFTTNMTLNANTSINKAIATVIGESSVGNDPFDGYMTEVNFIDGQQLAPSSFGETDTTTGSWKPKAYTGTYGTNGFYLKFSDIATTSGSNAGLGKDFSGNANYWTTNNISVTAGTTYDAMTDSPTLTSATVANYCVLNPLTAQGNTVVDGNLKVTLGTSFTAGYGVRGSLAITSGNKYYWEIQPTTTSSVFTVIGIMDANYKFLSDIGLSGSNCVLYYKSSGNKIVNGTTTSYGTTYAANDIIGVAVDYSTNTCTFYLNNVSQGSISLPSTSIDYIPVVGNENGVSDVFQANFGQRPFSYTPPTGFVRLNTYNLPDSTIKKGSSYMDATLYTGNGSTQTITNAASFKPDLVWLKSRSDAYDNVLIDSVRGTFTSGGNPYYGRLFSNTTAAQNVASLDTVTALNSNGFSVNSAGAGSYVNNTSSTYVGWQWQAGQGTNTSNTSGSTTSTVSVNATAGFSVVTYTGTGSAATIGHGLGVAPKWIVVKGRNATIEWLVYHASLGATQYITLNTTGAAASAASAWNNTAPTSTVFSVLSAGSTNFSGTTYVAYCWAEIAGFSKFTSYTGNGNADGPFVYLGFRPKFVLVKASSSVEAWYINDSARDTYNPDLRILAPNLADAEFNNGSTWMDLTSNGFKIRYNTAPFNTSGATYIVAAWAENPFKNSLAR